MTLPPLFPSLFSVYLLSDCFLVLVNMLNLSCVCIFVVRFSLFASPSRDLQTRAPALITVCSLYPPSNTGSLSRQLVDVAL